MKTTPTTFFHLALALLAPLTVVQACGSSQVQPPGDEDDTGTSDDTGTTDTPTGEPCVEDPKAPVELLNACSDASCEPFANTRERLPLLGDDGKLPPLP